VNAVEVIGYILAGYIVWRFLLRPVSRWVNEKQLFEFAVVGFLVIVYYAIAAVVLLVVGYIAVGVIRTILGG
jgi:hypothetical protein